MLRINLLPPYIYEGAKRRNAILLWAVVIIAVAAFAVLGKIRLDSQARAIAAETAKIKPDADLATSTAAQAKNIQDKSADIRDKAAFVDSAIRYVNDTYPQLFGNISLYTLHNVMYDSITPSGNTVTMEAYARSLADVAHYMMAMERNNKIDNVAIQIGSLPTFPVPSGFNTAMGASGVRPRDGRGHNFTVTLSLVSSVSQAISNVPRYPKGSGPVGAAAGSPGMGGPGGMMGSSGMMMSTGGGSMSGYGGPPPGVGGPPRGMSGPGSMSGYGGPPPGVGGPPRGVGGPPRGMSGPGSMSGYSGPPPGVGGPPRGMGGR